MLYVNPYAVNPTFSKFWDSVKSWCVDLPTKLCRRRRASSILVEVLDNPAVARTTGASRTMFVIYYRLWSSPSLQGLGGRLKWISVSALVSIPK